MGLNSSGLEALSFLGINIVRDSNKCFGRLPQTIQILNIRARISTGIFLSSLAERPSGPGAEPWGGKAARISLAKIGLQRSISIARTDSIPGVEEFAWVMILSQKGIMTTSGGTKEVLLFFRRLCRQMVRFFFHWLWTREYSARLYFLRDRGVVTLLGIERLLVREFLTGNALRGSCSGNRTSMRSIKQSSII